MTIAVDFDGVIHTYSRGWRDGSIYDAPVPHALSSITYLMRDHSVFVHTSRKPHQVARWIEQMSGYGIECTTRLPREWWGRRKGFWNTKGILLVTDRKYPAEIYIDDRAYHFTSWEKTLLHLRMGV